MTHFSLTHICVYGFYTYMHTHIYACMCCDLHLLMITHTHTQIFDHKEEENPVIWAI